MVGTCLCTVYGNCNPKLSVIGKWYVLVDPINVIIFFVVVLL